MSNEVKGGIGLVLFIVTILGVGAVAFPTYRVWQQEMAGKAELAEATYSRQIAIEEAEAEEEASKALARADTIRARGVAESNKIIGQSLQNNPEYIDYLYITNLGKNDGAVIYVPTEAGLPVTEAGKRGTE